MVHLEELGGAGQPASHPAEAFVKGIVSPHSMVRQAPAEDCGEDCGGCLLPLPL